jgi:hypothetical protein
MPALRGRAPAELLALTAQLPGNLRFSPGPNGDVILRGEVRASDEIDVETATARLHRLLAGPPAEDGPLLEEDQGEAALAASGLAWARREALWVVPAAGSVAWEMLVRRVPAGVRVEATLVEWDEVGAAPAAALAQLLWQAQAGLRCARCTLEDRRARVVSLATSEYLDADLLHSLLGVATACRLLAREAAALLWPELAAAFLEFHRQD